MSDNTRKVTLFYRDGANYKFTVSFNLPAHVIDKFVVGDEVEYDNDLEISQQQFHDAIGSDFNHCYDHNYVTIETIA
jgi:hypothetical protein